MDIPAVSGKLQKRITDLENWLKENGNNCKEKQGHLEDGPERVYWHYGYMMALKDVSRFLNNETAKLN